MRTEDVFVTPCQVNLNVSKQGENELRWIRFIDEDGETQTLKIERSLKKKDDFFGAYYDCVCYLGDRRALFELRCGHDNRWVLLRRKY